MFVTGIRLHFDNPKSSPGRVQGFLEMAVGIGAYLYAMSHPVFDPNTPCTSDRAISLAGGFGNVIFTAVQRDTL
jgi:hypothetical protein